MCKIVKKRGRALPRKMDNHALQITLRCVSSEEMTTAGVPKSQVKKTGWGKREVKEIELNVRKVKKFSDGNVKKRPEKPKEKIQKLDGHE